MGRAATVWKSLLFATLGIVTAFALVVIPVGLSGSIIERLGRMMMSAEEDVPETPDCEVDGPPVETDAEAECLAFQHLSARFGIAYPEYLYAAERKDEQYVVAVRPAEKWIREAGFTILIAAETGTTAECTRSGGAPCEAPTHRALELATSPADVQPEQPDDESGRRVPPTRPDLEAIAAEERAAD